VIKNEKLVMIEEMEKVKQLNSLVMPNEVSQA
jgi:hypothetical protein